MGPQNAYGNSVSPSPDLHGNVSSTSVPRNLPKLKNGLQDQYKAMIDLQCEAQDRRDREKKFQEKDKKKAYLNMLKAEIDKKQGGKNEKMV